MTARPILVALLGTILLTASTQAQDRPRVYDVENTGADCEAPPFPSYSNLPTVASLPDPFAWSDGSGRIGTFEDWRCRRAEIAAEIQEYELGYKPEPPSDLAVRYANGALTITVTEDGDSITLTAPVDVPDGDGPFPVMIGAGSFGSGVGSLPGDIFASRDVAVVRFNVGDISTDTHGGNRSGDFYSVYSTSIGKMAGWAWGVSRIIDAIEQTPELNLDTSRIGVTGCSFAGKIALFSGAFDERIALTIAQEPGGGGAAAWRVSDTLGNVETLNATNGSWFAPTFKSRFGNTPEKLPFDHHELMALVAPRALLVLGNPDYEWLAEEAAHVSGAAAYRVWSGLGVRDRFGLSIVDGHGHCQLPNSQRPEVEAFVDKFLLGDEGAETRVVVSPYQTDLSTWIPWSAPDLAQGTTVGDGLEVGGDLGLAQNRPNPFVAETTIEYTVRKAAPVDLAVYNVLGQRVRTLVSGTVRSGAHAVTWDGTDDAGVAAPAGVYVYRVSVGDERATGRMVRL